jgi:L-malate glycosyltransferase
MKVLILIQRPQARGAELFGSHLAEELLQKGHEVSMISLFEGQFNLPFSGKIYRLNRNPLHRFFDLWAWKKINDLVRDLNPDIVQAMGGDTLKFMVFSQRLFRWKGKKIFFNGSLISRYIQSPAVRWFNSWLYQNLDGVIAVSQASKLDFENLFRSPGLHQIIPVGIRIPKEVSPKENFPNPVLIHIGGFTFEKDHPELFRVFSGVLAKKPKTNLWLIGEGPLRMSMEELAVEKGLGEAVLFFGALGDPFAKVPKNSILVLSSKIEGMPAVIGEAFLHRIPVVAFDVGAVSELVKTMETGWLIPPANTEQMVEAILDLIHMDPAKLSGILDAAEKFARENLTINRVADQYERFYLTLTQV